MSKTAHAPDVEAPVDPPAYDDDAPSTKFTFGWCDYIGVSLVIFLSISFTIAITLRMSTACARNSGLDCRIPECLCGTPDQLAGCVNFTDPRDASCSAEQYRVYVASGSQEYTKSNYHGTLLGAAASTLLVLISAWQALTGRRTTHWKPLRQQNIDRRSVVLVFSAATACVLVVFLMFGMAYNIVVVLARIPTTIPWDRFGLVLLYLSHMLGLLWMVVIFDLHE